MKVKLLLLLLKLHLKRRKERKPKARAKAGNNDAAESHCTVITGIFPTASLAVDHLTLHLPNTQ